MDIRGIITIFILGILIFGCVGQNSNLENNTTKVNSSVLINSSAQNTANQTQEFSLKKVLIDQAINGGLKKGNATAKVVLIEFTDYQCPFCRRAHFVILPNLTKNYIENGKIEYIKRDLPITSIHNQAQLSAEAVKCAQEQGKGWQMHDELFRVQDEVGGSSTVFFGPTDIKFVANKTGLVIEQYDQCIKSGKYTNEVKNDIEIAKKLGFSGTPSYLIVKRGSENAVPIIGAQGVEIFSAVIDEMLKN